MYFVRYSPGVPVLYATHNTVEEVLTLLDGVRDHVITRLHMEWLYGKQALICLF